MRFALLALALIGCSTGCHGGGSDDEDRPSQTVPPDVKPEDATFKYVLRNGNLNVLSIRLSTISLCNKDAVPSGHSYVQVDVGVSLSETIGPGTYAIDDSRRTGASLVKTSGASCSGSAGSGASTGFVKLDEVSPTTVRGSFVGTNADTKLDLRASFTATACTGDPNQTCL